MADVDKPIEVPGSALPAQVVTALQYLIATGTAFAVGKGWVSSDTATQIGAMILPLAAAAYGIYKTWKNNEEKKTIIQDPKTRVPTSVAKVVS